MRKIVKAWPVVGAGEADFACVFRFFEAAAIALDAQAVTYAAVRAGGLEATTIRRMIHRVLDPGRHVASASAVHYAGLRETHSVSFGPTTE